MALEDRDSRRRFRRIAAAGIIFQGGTAAVDSSTIIAALVHGLTGNSFAVGAAAAILRYGWLFPQIFVAYLAQRRRRRMLFYLVGAFGRATCLAGVALALAMASVFSGQMIIALFFVLWTAYSFVSGIVAVPYNDIVARSVTSKRRSRLLAIRFFGGGLLAIGVAALAHYILNNFGFPAGYAVLVSVGSVLLFASTISFGSTGELPAPEPPASTGGLVGFLREGVDVFRSDRRFHLFVHSQWLGGLVMMALPFYILQVIEVQGTSADVAVLLGAQTVGALASNVLWGWWGDRHGKQQLLEGVAALRAAPPVLTLAWVALGSTSAVPSLVGFVVVFLLLGALSSGTTIAMIGYLMEISPNDRRPAYSGYFNAAVAPAALFPLLGAAVVETTSLTGLFVVSAVAAALQFLTVRRLRGADGR